MAHAPAIFAYWNDYDLSLLSNFTTEWRSEFSQFRLFGDDDAIPLIKRHFPEHVELYKAIRIPAAKADIARLLLLYEFGGLYVDCHCGIRDADGIRRLILSLDQMELIFVDRRLSQQTRPADEHFFLNSIIFSRPGSDLIFTICRQALANLAAHREEERKSGKVPYRIGRLSGPGLVTAMALQPGSGNRYVKRGYERRIMIVREEIAPIVRDRHRTYGGPGQHWSERQAVELLFES